MFQLKHDLLRDALYGAFPIAATRLAVCEIKWLDFCTAVTALYHDPLYLHRLLSLSPAPHTKVHIPQQEKTCLPSPPLCSSMHWRGLKHRRQ